MHMQVYKLCLNYNETDIRNSHSRETLTHICKTRETEMGRVPGTTLYLSFFLLIFSCSLFPVFKNQSF